MGLKSIVLVLLYFAVMSECTSQIKTYNVDGIVPRGAQERKSMNDKDLYPAPPTRELKRIVVGKPSSQSSEESKESKSDESKESSSSSSSGEGHVVHPVPPSGPQSRIVLTSLGKSTEKPIDLKGAASGNLNGKTLEADDDHEHSLKENDSYYDDDDDYDDDVAVIDERSAVSMELPLYRLKPTFRPIVQEKEDLKEGVVNAFHHKISGDRKEYFKTAISKMTKEELADLNLALTAALTPKPDDDVKVEEVKEEFKEAVHELVEEKQKDTDKTDDKKEALIEIEHVLEEQKPTKESMNEKKQVIRMQDWKRKPSVVVGGVVKEDGKEGEIPPPAAKKSDDLTNKGAAAEASTTDEQVTKEKGFSNVSPSRAPKENAAVAGINTNPTDSKGAAEPSKNETADEKKEETVDFTTTKPTEKRVLRRLRISTGSVVGGILTKTGEAVMEDKKSNGGGDESKQIEKEEIADSITQPDGQMEEIVKVVKMKGVITEVKEDNNKSRSGSNTEQATASTQIKEKLGTQAQVNCTSTFTTAGEEGKGVATLLGRRGGRGMGRGWGREGMRNLRRPKRHSRIYYRRTPYVTHSRRPRSLVRNNLTRLESNVL